jgi:hypothetical protein
LTSICGSIILMTVTCIMMKYQHMGLLMVQNHLPTVGISIKSRC